MNIFTLISSKLWSFVTIILSWLLKGMITVYKYTVSPLLGAKCRYLPTCSSYSMEAIDRFGPFIGVWLTVKRIGRCHPWGGHGYDPVPKTYGKSEAHGHEKGFCKCDLNKDNADKDE